MDTYFKILIVELRIIFFPILKMHVKFLVNQILFTI